MSSVIETNEFNNKRAVSLFRRLTNLIEKREDEILSDPLKHINIANEQLMENAVLLRELKSAAYPVRDLDYFVDQEPIFEPMEIVRITLEDYECLQNLREIIDRSGL